MPRPLSAFVVALALAVALPERHAEALDDVLTPRAIALGSALRADASGALGPLLNPAGMSLKKAYTLEAMYGFRVQGLESDVHLSVVDSSTSKVAAGVYYSFVHGTPKVAIDGIVEDTTREGSEAGLALSVPIGERFFVGTTLKYVHVATTAANPANTPTTMPPLAPLTLDSSTSSAATDGFTFDFGMLVRAGDKLNLALVGYNLIPLHSFDAPLSLGTGFAYKPKDTFTLAADVRVDFDKYRTHSNPPGGGSALTTVAVGGGLEYLAAGKVALRAGTLYDSGRHAYYLSCGLAYVSTKFAVDLSYRQEAAGGIESYLVAGLRVFLQ